MRNNASLGDNELKCSVNVFLFDTFDRGRKTWLIALLPLYHIQNIRFAFLFIYMSIQSSLGYLKF